MAIMEQAGSGEIVAAWVPTRLADQVKEHAQAERRSVSSVVRHLIEDSFTETGELRRSADSSFPAAAPEPSSKGES